MKRAFKVCDECGARYQTVKDTCPLDGAQLRELSDPLSGLNIAGRYVLEKQIGAGGMATVYRARTVPHDELVAIKFLDKALTRSKSNRERFLREAKAANRIDHEHIIDITNFGETEDGLVYLVMEYLDGKPLNTLIHAGPLPIPRALDIAQQIAEALARAHDLDVVHRDIKPENIFVLKDDSGADFVKVLDFGLAQVKGEQRLTMTGAVFGTPEYMAPEQCLGKRATHSVDIYALGAVLFELLTGRPPYGGSIAEMLESHVKKDVPSPRVHRSDLPASVEALIMKMMAKEPADRHRDAHHVIENIASLVGSKKKRRSRVTSIKSESRTIDIANAWSKRVAQFEQWMPLAYPKGPPTLFTSSLQTLKEKAHELETVRKELNALNLRLDEQEKEDREVRMQIGNALDELARDASRIKGRTDEVDGQLASARDVLAGVERPLKAAWRTVPAVPDGMPNPDVVRQLAHLGSMADEWSRAQAEVARIAKDADKFARERRDLDFQISQLKKRLNEMADSSENAQQDTETRAQALDQRRRELLQDLSDSAETIYKAFMDVPGFRERMSTGKRAAH